MAVIALVALSGCAGRGAVAAPVPEVASAAVRQTAPDRPIRAVFDWRVLDGEARFSGQGAARVEGPYRARLDLFGPRGEGYLSAALVEEDIRLPAGEAEDLVPPPAMMWALLGVVRPPEAARLARTRESGDEVELDYELGGTRLRYQLRAGRLAAASLRGGGYRMAVDLDGFRGGLPETAAYRDWSRQTELHIELQRVEEVEPYPTSIWTPGW